MNARYIRRLRNVIRALRESPEPKDFTMKAFGNACGTPACALGHYAFRKDLQRAFQLGLSAWQEMNNKRELKRVTTGEISRDKAYLDSPLVRARQDRDNNIFHDDPEVLEHFGITEEEAEDLFGRVGCNGAQTPREAINYINKFIAKKVRE